MQNKSSKEKNPRRYGKVQIEKDIVSQGGQITELQKTMLALNELKSMFINLHGKGTSDRYHGTNKISETEGEIIRDAIANFKIKVASALEKKKLKSKPDL